MVSWLPSPTAILNDYVDRSTSQIFHHQSTNSNLHNSNSQQPFLYSSSNSYYPSSKQQQQQQQQQQNHSSVNSSINSSYYSSKSSSTNKKCFPCPFPGCLQTSSNKGNLSKHIATRHEHRKDFVCPFYQCNRRFAKKYNMLRHLSASGVHRSTKMMINTNHINSSNINSHQQQQQHSIKLSKKSSDRAKWSSMELDLASFLAKQCQSVEYIPSI